METRRLSGIEGVNGARGGHAIVIGASMAGLLSARVLADHFERVTVIERDRLPQGPEFRSGVPQSRHLHALLVQGRVLLEQLSRAPARPAGPAHAPVP